MTPTTSGNIVRVGGYSGFSVALTLLVQTFLHMDPAVAGAFVLVLTVAAAALWNTAKDQGWIKDNRGVKP